MSTSENESAQAVSPKSWLASYWLPAFWGLLVGAIVVGVRFTGLTSDYVNTVELFSVPTLVLGLVFWVLFLSGLPGKKRVLFGLVPLLVFVGFVLLVEIENNGDMEVVGLKWRWQDSKDQQLSQISTKGPIDLWEATSRDYPGFLGGKFWAEVAEVQLQTDWEANPPRKLWSKSIGAGWSGFAVVGNYAVTQEQRGGAELVSCYEVKTGEVVWTHSDPVRWDPGGAGALGYAGPRATPTIYEGKVYAQGATGIVNCLDARSGKMIWSHDTLTENKIESVLWGKAGSPLIVEREEAGPIVVISVGASDGRSLIAYHAETGDEVWAGGDRRSSYASPIETNLLDERQVLSVNEGYVTSQRVSDGTVLWEHPWPGNSDSDASVSQPVPLAGDRVFLSKGYGEGARLLQLAGGGEEPIKAEIVWKKRVMKTKMGNAVFRDGFVYGLDGGVLQCIELDSGKKQWKKRRGPADIGHGQIMLIGDVILALSESGEVILIEANPKKFRELASMRVFDESQITWNNPAFSSPYLLVRNAEEAACYELPIVSETDVAVTQKQ